MKKIEIFRIPKTNPGMALLQLGIYNFLGYHPYGDSIPVIECDWGWRSTKFHQHLPRGKICYNLFELGEPYWRFLNGIVICGVKGEKDENR